MACVVVTPILPFSILSYVRVPLVSDVPFVSSEVVPERVPVTFSVVLSATSVTSSRVPVFVSVVSFFIVPVSVELLLSVPLELSL